MIVLVSQDLMFASRLKQSAEQAAVRLRLSAGVPDFSRLPEPLTLAIIDLHLPGLNVDSTVNAFRAATPQAKVIAYAGHAMIEALRAARAAGCDEVLTRGEFDRRMDELVDSFGRLNSDSLPQS